MKKKLLLTLLLTVVSMLVTIGGTYAWFELFKSDTYSIQNGNFDIDIVVYLDNVEVTTSNQFYSDITKTIELNAYDETSDNYINKLKVSISVTAHNASRFRIKIMDQWTLTRTYTNETVKEIIIASEERDETHGFESRYHYSSSFFRLPDQTYFYYDGLLLADQTVTLDFITGADQFPENITQSYTEQVSVMFSMYVDCVQANRIEEVWGVDVSIFD